MHCRSFCECGALSGERSAVFGEDMFDLLSGFVAVAGEGFDHQRTTAGSVSFVGEGFHSVRVPAGAFLHCAPREKIARRKRKDLIILRKRVR